MSDTRHTVDPRFVFKRQGKDMVLYAGLVDAAHRAGLVGIHTEIVQFPNADNDHTTIVHAKAYFPGDDHTDVRSFSGVGDANPRNVGANIAPHAIRMAETRAKARALRDALNVGMVTIEELGGDDEQPAPARKQRPPAEQLTANQQQAVASAWDMATSDTYAAVLAMLRSVFPGATPGQLTALDDERQKIAARHFPDAALTR